MKIKLKHEGRLKKKSGRELLVAKISAKYAKLKQYKLTCMILKLIVRKPWHDFIFIVVINT